MGAIWLRARAEAAAHGRAWVVMGVLVGLAAGGATAAAAAARRTESAYPRFLAAQSAMDIVADVGRDGRDAPVEAVRALPSVRDVALVQGLFGVQLRTPSGRNILFPDAFPVVAADGRFGTDVNVLRAIEGRAVRHDVVGEVAVGVSVAKRFGLSVGGTLSVPSLDFGVRKPAEPIELRIVGIVVMPGELQPLSGASMPAIHFTKAFFDRYRNSFTCEQCGEIDAAMAIRLAGGPRAVDAFVRDATAAGLVANVFFEQAKQTESVQRSVRFQSVSMWMLALLTSIAAAAILGQSLVRHAMSYADEYPTLRALGMSRAQLVAVALARAAAISGIGVIVGTGTALAMSPLAPVGLARLAEPDPGFALDLPALGLGALGVLVLVGSASILAQLFLRPSATRAGAAGGVRTSRIAEGLARAGVRPSLVVGVRMALEPGRGRTAVPIRSTILSGVLGVSAIVGAVTFGGSAAHLGASPRLTGWPFDVAVSADVDPTEEVGRRLREFLASSPAIEGSYDGSLPTLLLEGRHVLETAFALPPELGPTIAEGSPPQGEDEIALGRDTMRAIGVEIGDRISVAALPEVFANAPSTPGPPRSMLVTGRMIMPSLGFNLGTAGEGASITLRGMRALRGGAGDDDAGTGFFLRLRPGYDTDGFTRELKDRFGAFVISRAGNTAVAEVNSISAVPVVLATLIGLLAFASLLHALQCLISRRRRDLAILKTLGFVRGQIGASIASKSLTLVLVSLAIGVPAGIVLGRWAWVLFADSIGVLGVPVLPLRWIGAIAAGVLLVARVVAIGPSRGAARMQPAVVLRGE